MTTVYKVHPAIGVARVGNSPEEHFVGPERPDEYPAPADGFKDDACRVKRQAARFRVLAHHDDGTVQEVTSAQATIAWTVHLANGKAAFDGRGNTEPAADLTIDPGPRTLDGPKQSARFDTGTIHFAGQPVVTVPLGEIVSDEDGRLLVLGGTGASASPAGNGIQDFWGNPGWYDDVADGPVTATLTLPDGSSPPVEGAWVLVAPPKFAPQQQNVITLYDRLLPRMVEIGLATEPTTTSYTRDIYPILRRAADSRWVKDVGRAHSWAHPVTDQRTVNRIAGRLRPTGDMPLLDGEDAVLTPIQAAHVARWKAGTYTNDWAGEPVPPAGVTPDGLDRAALEACVGGAFFPGIEAGGQSEGVRPILESAYTAAFRLDHAQVAAGAITASMALPWQADFSACGDTWWPVPRPNDVFGDVAATTQIRWDRDVSSGEEMVAHWHTLGFVVARDTGGGVVRHVETEHCVPAPITLLTPHVSFDDVAQGPLGMVSEAVLSIRLAVHSATTLELVAPDHPQLEALTRSVTVDPADNPFADFAIAYRTGVAPSSLPTQTLTVREPSTGTAWAVTVDANTVARRATATALVVDRSGSMATDGRRDAVRRAATVFAALLPEGDGAGVVGFDADAEALQPVGDTSVVDTLNGDRLDPRGASSIGDGVVAGVGLLGAASGFGSEALVVLTDGLENAPAALADVSADVRVPTYVIEVGQPHSIGVPALTDLTANNGGYVLTCTEGDAVDAALDVVATVTGAEVVTEAAGRLTDGTVLRIPFSLTDADGGFDVVLRSSESVDFRLQTPNGLLIEPWYALQQPSMRYGTGDGLAWYRIALPVQPAPGRFEQGGTWNVVVTPGAPRLEPIGGAGGEAHGFAAANPAATADVRGRTDTSILHGLRHRPVPHVAGGFAAAVVPAEPPQQWRSERERAYAVISGPEVDAPAAFAAAAPEPAGTPFQVRVHAWSSISLQGFATQNGFAPGSEVALGANLAQSGQPITADAVVSAEVVTPTGQTRAADLTSSDGSLYEGTFTVTDPGTYRIRFTASGRARNGQRFTRERHATAAAWAADTPVPSEG
ncbi:LodA/GoxA family CTQ-dependent oxidase [Cryptosporangium sp. NPDC051539]|uniref:LodA/GoxA family CTQ-dependent oxidase n=1 Tax=Cryptosporangium sp. NPDC051539 TaxID=3363962 RepID=UPI00379FD1C5